MPKVRVTRQEFLEDRQGKTFADVLAEPSGAFDAALAFFDDADRQRRMEESELHHDRAPLAGVVRELESLPVVDALLAQRETKRNTRFRQAVGVLVRIVMERRGWRKTGRKGSLGVRRLDAGRSAAHNTGGLAFWFLRAERYELPDGMPYIAVQDRCERLEAGSPRRSSGAVASASARKPPRRRKSLARKEGR